MIITVDRSRCQGHGRCAAIAPALFALDDEGFVVTERLAVADADMPLARRAIRACPEGIIAEQTAAASSTSSGSKPLR